jgi:hypothetical protein
MDDVASAAAAAAPRRPMDLIHSFPSPPTHIHVNPPPSRPPSVPLPPLPGPSRYDTLNILNRPRRISKISLDIPETSIPDYDDDYDDAILDLAIRGTTMLPTPPSSNPSPIHISRKHRHIANESISSIDIRDLMLDNDNIYADDSNPNPIYPIADPIDPLHIRNRHLLRGPSASSPLSSPPSDPLPPIPGSQISLSPSSPIRTASPDIQTIISTTPRPSRRSKSQPRTRSSVASTSSLPSRSLSKSTSTEIKRRASEGVVDPPSARKSRGRRLEPLSTYSEPAIETSQLPYIRGKPPVDDDARSWIEPHEFGVKQSSSPTATSGPDDADRLERALEGNGSDSDSSLDLHTPLP